MSSPSGGWKFCPSCGASLTGEGRFCTTCGTPLGKGEPGPSLGGGPGTAASRAGWGVAGLLLAALVLVIAFPAINASSGGTTGGPPVMAGGGGAGPGVAPNVDLSAMSPREAADRLFDRVMRAVQRGDTTEVFNFVPMAVAAYDRAQPLDADGFFHLSLLQAVSFDFTGALATAQTALSSDPDHLLLLSAAAGAAAALADTVAAARYYRHALDVYDVQRALGLPEYEEHAALLPLLRTEAESFLEGARLPG
jgi:hypothetical protein